MGSVFGGGASGGKKKDKGVRKYVLSGKRKRGRGTEGKNGKKRIYSATAILLGFGMNGGRSQGNQLLFFGEGFQKGQQRKGGRPTVPSQIIRDGKFRNKGDVKYSAPRFLKKKSWENEKRIDLGSECGRDCRRAEIERGEEKGAL